MALKKDLQLMSFLIRRLFVSCIMSLGARGRLVAGAIGMTLIVSSALGGESDWPSWRGPLETELAPQGTPPTRWSETENVKWKVKLPGQGTATPIVWEDKI